ncbi:MAG: fumarylacetoacetate hydrolase family protein [Chloroflexota bacterium]|nr:fumarylacetoacetate hydrolase family protein [Chloroflexota bacterium]
MHLITFQHENRPQLGILQDDHILPVETGLKRLLPNNQDSLPSSMIGLLEMGEEGLGLLKELQRTFEKIPDDGRADLVLALGQVTLRPPVLDPEKVICLGLNYLAHAAEKNHTPPEYPMLFHKTAGSLLGAGGDIVIPPITEQVDYEGELAIIIGRTCKAVSQESAIHYVAGYTVANDVSARDLQYRTKQFTSGKMLDTFCPLGPALVTRDEIPNPNGLSIRTTLNGQIMQDDNTGQMIFDVPLIVSYISQIATLRPGDVILTGTPQGVGFARDPQVFLQAGDEITVEIEGLGRLTNRVVK